MSQAELICISGWASTARAWGGVLAAAASRSSFRHAPWWDCLDGACGALGCAIESSERPVVLLGWSLGAIISLDAALRWPGGIRALVLVSGTARMTADGDWPGADPRALRAMQSRLPRNPGEVLDDFAQMCIEPQSDTGFVEAFAQGARACPADSLAEGLAYLAATDLRSAVAGVEIPTLLLHGSEDRVIPAAAALRLAELLPNATLQSLDGLGHALPFTAPGLLADAVKGFLHEHAA